MSGPKLIGLQKFYAEGNKVRFNLFVNVQTLAKAAYPKTKYIAEINHATTVRDSLTTPTIAALRHANNELISHSGANPGLLPPRNAEFMMKYFLNSLKKKGAQQGSMPTPTTAELTALGYTNVDPLRNQQAFLDEYTTVFIPNLPTLLHGHNTAGSTIFLSPTEKQELLDAIKAAEKLAASEALRANALMLEIQSLSRTQNTSVALFLLASAPIEAAVAAATASGFTQKEAIDAAREAAKVASRAGMSDNAIVAAGLAAAQAMGPEITAALAATRAINMSIGETAGAAAAAATTLAEDTTRTALSALNTPEAIKNQTTHLGYLTDKGFIRNWTGIDPFNNTKSILEHLEDWLNRTTDTAAVQYTDPTTNIAVNTNLAALRTGTDAQKAMAKDIDKALTAENMHPPAANPKIKELTDEIAILNSHLAITQNGITKQQILDAFGANSTLDALINSLTISRDQYKTATQADTYILLNALVEIVTSIKTLESTPSDPNAKTCKENAERILSSYYSDPAKRDKIDKKIKEKYGNTFLQNLESKLYFDSSVKSYEDTRTSILAQRTTKANIGSNSYFNPFAYSITQAVLPKSWSGQAGDLAHLNDPNIPLVAVPSTDANFNPDRDSVLVNLHYKPEQKAQPAVVGLQDHPGMIIDNNFRINTETGKFNTEIESKNRLIGLMIHDVVGGTPTPDTGNGKLSSLLNDPARNNGIGALPPNTKFICEPKPGYIAGIVVYKVTTRPDGTQIKNNPSAKELEIIYKMGMDLLTEGLQKQHNKVRQTAPDGSFLTSTNNDPKVMKYSPKP